MKNRLLNTLKNWLQADCDYDSYYKTNRHYANDCLSDLEMFKEATGKDIWALVDCAPDEFCNKKDDYGQSLDLLWAEEQVADIFERA